MSKKLLPLIALLALGACASNAKNEPAPAAKAPADVINVSASKPLDKGVGRTEVQFTEVSVVVKAVNVKKRTITVVGPDKKVSTFDVDPAVKRLAEIKPGNKIVLQYFQSLAFEVREPTPAERKSPKVVAEAAGKNPETLPPGMGAARSVHAIVTIQAIDRTKQTVTVKGPEGRVVEVEVMDPKNLEKIKLGDTVAVTYTEGLAVGIDPES